MPQLYNLIACLLDNFNATIVFINFFKLPSLPTRHDRRSTHSVDMKQTGDFFFADHQGQLYNELLRYLDERHHDRTEFPLPNKRVVIPLSTDVCTDTAVSISEVSTISSCADIKFV